MNQTAANKAKPRPPQPSAVPAHKPLTADIERMVNDAQRLLSYMAQAGDLTLPEDVTEKLVSAKYRIKSNQWTANDEAEFILSYDQLAEKVYPVTIESIRASCPNPMQKHAAPTKAEKAVKFYRRYTMLALISLLVVQVYWLVGADLNQKLKSIFDERDVVRNHISQLEGSKMLSPELFAQSPENQHKLTQHQDEADFLTQKLDANYQLLLVWNHIWLLGQTISSNLPKGLQAQFDIHRREIERLEKTDPVLAKQLRDKQDLERSNHEAQTTLHANMLAASFALNAFQSYLLPLLYGLLGAFIYVLRTLLREIRSLTYSFDSEIRYRLRLTLGALGGMIVGWFLKPEDAGALASLSPMALSFLMGYNVDVLFSLMDRIIDNIRSYAEAPSNEKKTEPKAATTPTTPATPTENKNSVPQDTSSKT